MSDPAIGQEHYTNRTGWLRAAVLGANDGLLSTASLMAGVAAASASTAQLILTGVAGIAAGAMSMAAGEYVSVSSQADSEAADLARESHELRHHPEQELDELAQIYSERGLHPPLAKAVAQALTANDALDAHARDELGITEHNAANPFQAAGASALSFVAGGIAPLATVIVCRPPLALYVLFATAAVVLALLGALGARAGGAPVGRAVVRVVSLGMAAMAITAAVGRAFHAVV
jgi:VIT1/CCC1 family predicted Fe2+/Mn2+ transporter